MVTATRRDGYVRRDTTEYSYGEGLIALANEKMDPTRAEHWHEVAAAALGSNTASGSEGGFLTREAFSDAFLRSIHGGGALLPHTTRFPLAAGATRIRIPMVDDADRSDGSLSGVDVSRVAEGEAIPTSKMLLKANEVKPSKLAALLPATDELRQDVRLLDFYVSTVVRDELSYGMDDEILNGTGVGESLGILNAGATVEVTKETGQAAATIIGDNLEAMAGRMYARSFDKARWYVGPQAIPQLMEAKEFTAPDSEAPAGRLLTRPIVVTEHAQPLGTKGDIVLADLSQYFVVERDLIVDFSEHFNFTKHEVAWRFVARIEGQPRYSQPITPRYGNETVSPFVVLAARA